MTTTAPTAVRETAPAAVHEQTVPGFGTVDNLYPLLLGFGFIGLAALGLAVTMIAGELDLSVGSVAAVAGILTIYLSGWGAFPTLAVAVAASAGFGAAQGLA